MVVLREIEGLSYEEIADLLHVNLGTVKSRLMRGRAALRAVLIPAADSPQAAVSHRASHPASAGEAAEFPSRFRSGLRTMQPGLRTGGIAMKSLPCRAIRASYSDYLDGAISGLRMQQIAHHIEGFEDVNGVRTTGCESCARELAAWRATQDAISALGPARAPADLALRLRVAISRERARHNSRLLDRLSLAWDNAVRPMLLQVAGGLVGSVALLGGTALLLGVAAAPQQVLANDEPLGALTAPHYLYSTASPGAIVTGHDTTIIVEASVDSRGRVYDYTIVSGPQDDAVRTQVANQLLGSVYQPASAFGVPVRGRVVVTFAGISVHG